MVKFGVYICVVIVICEITIYCYEEQTSNNITSRSTPAHLSRVASSNNGNTFAENRLDSGKSPEKKETDADDKLGAVWISTPEEMKADEARQQLINSNEYARLRTANETIRLQIRYGRLFKLLNLTSEAADKFVQLAYDRAHLGEDLNNATRGLNFGAAINAVREAHPVLEKQWENDIKELLGEQGYKTFNDYEKNIGSYMAVTQVQQALSGTGAQLTDGQTQAIAKIIIANPESKGQARFALRITPRDVSSDERGRLEIAGQNFVALDPGAVSIDENGRVSSNMLVSEAAIEASSGILKPAQIDALKRVRVEQLNARAVAAKLFRKRTDYK